MTNPLPLLCSALLFIACATSQQPVVSAPVESGDEKACIEAVGRASEMLQTESIRSCTSDLECKQVSGVITGSCETFVNERAFLEQRDAVRERISACRPFTQLVPTCPRVRPVCRAAHCVGEVVRELADHCAEQKTTLLTTAKGHRDCENDTQCTMLLGAPANAAWVESVMGAREAVASSCGVVPDQLFAVPTRSGFVRAPNEPVAVCTNNRCEVLTEQSRFTTTVREEEKTTPIQPPFDCLSASVHKAVRVRSERFDLAFSATVEKSGQVNQFQFTRPEDLSLQAKRAIAAQLHECRFTPATRGGRPVDLRSNFEIHVIMR